MKLADYIKTGINKWPNWLNLILLRCNVFGGWVYGGAYKRFLKQIDDINPEEKLLEMVNYAIENVPYYRKRYKDLRIHSVEEFEKKIGFIDKTEVMDHWDEFIADGVDLSKCNVGTTGGTSGKPMKLVLPQNRYVHSMAFWHKELKWFGWNYDTRAIIRNHRIKDGSNYMVNPILKEFIFDAFRMDKDYSKTIWKIMKKNNIRFIHAYPSAAYQFLKFCKNQKFDTSFINLCILTSEDVTEEQRYFIEEELKIKIYASYGHSEKLIMAGSSLYSSFYRIESCYGYCELVDENLKLIKINGKVGELVGTTFINKQFPLLRYRTGDFSSYADYNSKDYKLLNRVQGHWDKSIVYRSDGTYTSQTALNLHGEVYEHIDGLQYIQEKIGELIVLVIPNQNYTEADTAYFKEHFQNAMGKDSVVDLRFVDNLIFQKNGKFLPLISKVCL